MLDERSGGFGERAGGDDLGDFAHGFICGDEESGYFIIVMSEHEIMIAGDEKPACLHFAHVEGLGKTRLLTESER